MLSPSLASLSHICTLLCYLLLYHLSVIFLLYSVLSPLSHLSVIFVFYCILSSLSSLSHVCTLPGYISLSAISVFSLIYQPYLYSTRCYFFPSLISKPYLFSMLSSFISQPYLYFTLCYLPRLSTMFVLYQDISLSLSLLRHICTLSFFFNQCTLPCVISLFSPSLCLSAVSSLIISSLSLYYPYTLALHYF